MASAAMDTQKSPQFAQVFRGHIPELDGLRAFGITVVIVAHMWPYPQGSHHEIWNLLHLSWILMDCFFVLSGFLIAGILLDSRSRSDYYRAFYTRRALRILPIYYVVIAVFTWGTIFHGVGDLYGGNTALHKWASPWWYFVYLGNLPPAITGTTPIAARGSFGPLWSLQIEEQFYLLFPILVHRLKLQTLARTLLGLVCLSPLLRIALYWLYPTNTLVQYVLLPCRMEGLALGSLIAIRFRMGPWDLSNRKLTLMAIALVAITCIGGAWDGYVSTRPFNRTIGFLISPIACSSVLLWLIRFRGSQLTACMRFSPLQHLAKISYAAYLFHWPIGAALVPISAALGVGALGHGYLKVVTVFMLTVILASLSWRFFEGPLFRLKERLSARQVSIARAGSLLT
jgi:peptidoglycan/LPS O-acetylase OafA/YrhL